MMSRLLQLYKLTGGGHKMLSKVELREYAALRKAEFQAARAHLKAEGMTDVHPMKDDVGDIIGWTHVRPANQDGVVDDNTP